MVARGIDKGHAAVQGDLIGHPRPKPIFCPLVVAGTVSDVAPVDDHLRVHRSQVSGADVVVGGRPVRIRSGVGGKTKACGLTRLRGGAEGVIGADRCAMGHLVIVHGVRQQTGEFDVVNIG